MTNMKTCAPISTPAIFLTIGSSDSRPSSDQSNLQNYDFLQVSAINAIPFPNSQTSFTLPLPENPPFVLFDCTTGNIEDVVFKFTLESKVSPLSANSKKHSIVPLTGTLHLKYSKFEPMWLEKNQNEYTGRITLPFFSSSASLPSDTELIVECTTVKPFTHPRNTADDVQKIDFTHEDGITVIGHRGLGKNRRYRDFPSLTIGENTNLSFAKAGELGASFVEFDVQLTRNLEPVIYHDWVLDETGVNIPVNLLTVDQFLSIHPRESPNKSLPPPKLRRSKSSSGILDLILPIADPKSKTPWNGSWKSNFTDTIQQPFPTLAASFREVPSHIGFNIEVKYPVIKESLDDNLNFVGLNVYIDRILSVVFNEAKERKIYFSSFHPEACILLNLKQAKYPVLFLTVGKPTSNPRSSSLYNSTKFAIDAQLSGVVSFSRPIIENISDFRQMRTMLSETESERTANGKMQLVTWGGDNNNMEVVRKQVSENVDAVILDSVAWIVHGLRNGK
ncbi:Glycerophosphocholine phosphodiesterase [Nowakowskiella sp. JEL0407]|nr:Glycerophosphocholine phosphodiesterase [Nowakowskiella sp. JEL0407]